MRPGPRSDRNLPPDMAAYTFLGMNGYDLSVPEPEAVALMPALASGDLSESELAAWIRQNLEAL